LDGKGNFWNPIEILDKSSLKELELSLLKTRLEYFKTSEFYRNRLGVLDGTLENLRDLERIPFTVKDELRESQNSRPPFGLHQACPRNQIVRVYMTSGTTGAPTFVGLTKGDLAGWIECASRAYWAAGFRPNNWLVSSLAAGPFIAGTTHEGWQNIGCCLIPVGPGRTERIVDAFLDGKADCLSTTPSYAIYLLEHCQKVGIEPKQLGIKKMQFGGEPGWEKGLRSRIENAFDCSATESLGMGDVSVDFWGECEQKIGMHFCGQGIIYPELIDPDSLENVEWSEGATGELVYTHLTRECQPLLRFRSRDIVKVTAMSCHCGRTSPLIRVLGRSDDMFKVKAVTVFPTSVREIVREFAPYVTGEIQIELTHPATQTKAPVPIDVELAGSVEDRSKLRSSIEEAIHKKLLFRAEVNLVELGTLTRSEYKTRLVRFVDLQE
jgi:phenylacetate-CoA ligase